MSVTVLPLTGIILFITIIAMVFVLSHRSEIRKHEKMAEDVNAGLRPDPSVLPWTEKQVRSGTMFYYIFSAIAGIGSVCSAGMLITLLLAAMHGAYEWDMTLPDMLHSIRYSPIESHIPDDVTGAILLYYRFGCDDCEEIYDELRDLVYKKDNIYWVSTRSARGKELREDYPVEQVPTGIYVSHAGNGIYYKYLLHTNVVSEETDTTANETGESIEPDTNDTMTTTGRLDMNALARLIQAQQEGR